MNWVLVVGRSCGRADVQGTRCDSGTAPAAVTECFIQCRTRSSTLLAIVAEGFRHIRRIRDEKAGRAELGSQKTYQRITCRPPRGQRTVR